MDQFPASQPQDFLSPPLDDRNRNVEGRKWAGADSYYMKALVESSYDAVVATNMDGKVTVWNQGAEILFGFAAEEVLGNFVNMLAPLERKGDMNTAKLNLQAGEMHKRYETVRKRKDGTLVEVAITISSILDEAGEMIGASTVAHDLTDFRHVEAELREAEHRKDIFISMASHELKTPLTSIKAFAQVLAKMLPADNNNTAHQYLEKMEAQINKLTKLVSDLLDISHMQADKIEFTMKPFAIDLLLEEIVQETQAISPRHSIHIRDKTQATVVGDRERIGQVISNLLLNAVKFSPESEDIFVRARLQNQRIIISVRDQGQGIPVENQPYMFERFYRVHGEHDKQFPGLGIGLYIASEIVKQHAGEIWFESAEGSGSTFSFSLPLQAEP